MGRSKAEIATRLFQLQRVAYVNRDEFISLLKLYVFAQPKQMEILHHHLVPRHTAILMKLEGLHGLNYAQMYQDAVFGELNAENLCEPIFDENPERLERFFKSNYLVPEKTVVLCPYAISLRPINKVFWERLAEAFANRGFTVCTNSSDVTKEPAVKGTSCVFIPYDIAVPVFETAGYVIGLRSGLFDLANKARCRMVVLYTKKHTRGLAGTASDFESFSIKKMYNRHDILEIRDDFRNFDRIIKTILEF